MPSSPKPSTKNAKIPNGANPQNNRVRNCSNGLNQKLNAYRIAKFAKSAKAMISRLSQDVLGCATTLLTSTVLGVFNQDVSLPYITQYVGIMFCKVIGVATGIKLLLESSMLYFFDKENITFINKTALLMLRQLKTFTLWRFACSLVGGILLPILFIQMSSNPDPRALLICVTLIFGLTVAGELLERYLFFRAAVPLKMPGGKIG